MKNKFKILLSLLGLTLLFTACTPDNPQMAALLDKSALKFSVTQDATNPNKVILTSETPNVTPYWVTPMGNSTNVVDTVDFPFPGTDTIYYSVEGAGGLTKADPYVVNITTIDPAAVSGPMWVNLTGGYNQSKTWVLDVNPADGSSKLFSGPVYFAGLNADGTTWEWDASWYSWIMPLGDYGSMTFNLIGNANFSSDNKLIPALGSASGHFMLWPDKMELQTSGAQLIHSTSQGTGQNWYAPIQIVSLTANGLQIKASTNASNWVYYNYVSLDYYNSH
jgi:hypothetical protein